MHDYNSRLDELHAAILRVKLPHLRRWNERRVEIARRYTAGLRDLPLQLAVTPWATRMSSTSMPFSAKSATPCKNTSGPLLVDVPGATPSNLVVALGKDGNAYLLNRSNLGGISLPVAQAHVASSSSIQATATYQTAQGTYVVFANASQLFAL